MGGSNWDEMLGAMAIGIAGGGVCGIDDDDRGSSVSSATVVVLFVRLCLFPDEGNPTRLVCKPAVTAFLLLFFFAAALSFANDAFCAGVRCRARN